MTVTGFRGFRFLGRPILLFFFHGAPSCPAIRKSEGAVSEALVLISIRLTRCS